MRLIKRNVLRGPNYWSNFRHNLIELRIDLEEFDEVETVALKGFNEALLELLPTLAEHRCFSENKGGFLIKLKLGTFLGHVIEHIAIELQWLAGMKCGFGRARHAHEKGIYNVVFSYEHETAGILAGEVAFDIVLNLAQGKAYKTVTEVINTLKKIDEEERLGPSSRAIVKEAEARGIPWRRLDRFSLIMLGQGSNQRLIRATETNKTSGIAIFNAQDKELTKDILKEAHIPVPKGITVQSLDELKNAEELLLYPLVVKPKSSHHGIGITTDIRDFKQLELAYHLAKKYDEQIIVERFIEGKDYRCLTVNHKVVAVAERKAPEIVGDGAKSIRELIIELNSDPRRGEGHNNFLSIVEIDEVTQEIIRNKGLELDSVLPKNQTLKLKHAANLSSGGVAIDVTEEVHEDNIVLIERASRLLDIDICGIDLVARNIEKPIEDGSGAIIEINSSPGLRMHLSPSVGKARNVAAPIIDMLYPKLAPFRIPIVAVTGTNGKTTVARMMAHIAMTNGYNVGLTTTDGIYIADKLIVKGDCSGPESARTVLRDPLVNYAVFECARGGILRAGLGFDQCDVSVVTNISEDHLGIDGIHTLSSLARVKSVVPYSTKLDGVAVLNADDDLVYAMKDEIKCKIALFTVQKSNDRVAKHIEQNGLAAFLDGSDVMIASESTITRLSRIDSFPSAFFGQSLAMVKNILASALAGVSSGFSLENIKLALKAFMPNDRNLPGRMHLFNFKDYKLLIDYAHNEGAYRELKEYVSHSKVERKIGIIAATGDRRDIDIIRLGNSAAEIFDEIIIRFDKDCRGRSRENITSLLFEGIKNFSKHKEEQTKIIPDGFEALRYAIDNSPKNSFIFFFPDNVLEAIDYVKKNFEEGT